MFVKYNIAFILGYALSLIISFFLNTLITFKEKPTFIKFIKFPLVYLPNFIIQYVSVYIFVELLNKPEKLAYFIAAIIGVPITYLTMRFFVYKK